MDLPAALTGGRNPLGQAVLRDLLEGEGDVAKVVRRIDIGTTVTNPLMTSKTVTATITFEFLSTTTGRGDVTATYNFGNVAFTLQQITQPGLS